MAAFPIENSVAQKLPDGTIKKLSLYIEKRSAFLRSEYGKADKDRKKQITGALNELANIQKDIHFIFSHVGNPY